jgi:hypothetical protein
MCFSVDSSYENQSPIEKETSEQFVKDFYNALKKEVVSKKKFIVIELNPFNIDLSEVTTEQLVAELQKREETKVIIGPTDSDGLICVQNHVSILNE